eukprot:322067-Amorphochlora_amoeboformis.AAC.1
MSPDQGPIAFSSKKHVSRNSSRNADSEVVFNWHLAKSWVPTGTSFGAGARRFKCRSVACKWRRMHPHHRASRGHRKWHPIKRQLEDPGEILGERSFICMWRENYVFFWEAIGFLRRYGGGQVTSMILLRGNDRLRWGV